MSFVDEAASGSRVYGKKFYTSFKWYLEDYSLLKDYYSENVESPEFEIVGTSKKGSLIFEKRVPDPDEDFINVTVIYPSDFAYHTLKIKISFMNASHEIKHSEERLLTKTTDPKQISKMEVHEFDMGPEGDLIMKKGCFDNDILRLHCEITIIESIETSAFDVPRGRCLDKIFNEKLKEFLENDLFSDVTLVVGKKEFRAHKAILAAASPVYEAMFLTPMAEQAEHIVRINDIESSVFDAFLKSLYTGSIASREDKVGDILIVADKYQVVGLKNLCEKYIIEHLDGANAIKYLLLAHSHGFDKLKKRAVRVALACRKELTNSDGFKELCNYPELMADIFDRATATKGQ